MPLLITGKRSSRGREVVHALLISNRSREEGERLQTDFSYLTVLCKLGVGQGEAIWKMATFLFGLLLYSFIGY